MSSILFVRHAQAALFDANYDQLSELGQTQAGMLGKYLASLNLAEESGSDVGRHAGFDEVYVGPRRRHQQTAEAIFQQAPNLSCPVVELPQLDEHQVDRLVSQHIEQIAAAFPAVHQLHHDFCAADHPLERQRSFARLFEAVAGLWLTADCDGYGVESWTEFTSRVNEGIDAIVQREGRGRRILVLTSAGTITAALQRALNCPAEVALGLGWRIWNCSLTRFEFSSGRFTLDQFNSLPHLRDHRLWTYR